MVPAVVGPVELGEPETVCVFDHSLGPGAPHGGAQEEKRLDLAGLGVGGQRLVPDDRIGQSLKPLEVQCLVERAPWCRGGLAKTEAEGAGAVVRRVKQVVQFPKLGFAEMPLDDPPAPEIRPGVAECSEDAVQAGRLKDAAGEAQLDRIELHAVRPFELASSVDKAADGRAAAIDAQCEPARGDRLGLARQGDVDVAGAVRLRSHRRAPRSCRVHAPARAPGRVPGPLRPGTDPPSR